jgi:hypothetical protein
MNKFGIGLIYKNNCWNVYYGASDKIKKVVRSSNEQYVFGKYYSSEAAMVNQLDYYKKEYTNPIIHNMDGQQDRATA